VALASSPIRLAALGDLHCGRGSAGAFQPILARAVASAQVLALCGDLTDHGLPEEAHVLAREITSSVTVPTIAVLGNHDYETDRQDEIRRILEDAGVRVLDGEACEVAGVSFAGAKGFAGGFGRHTLGSWGERIIKAFVQEAMAEVLKLEGALARLRKAPRVAVLHYAPVRDTVEGEPAEIFPFLGSSRLEEPLNRYEVEMVLHGHVHNGRLEGRTSRGAPVYNVSLPLMRRASPEGEGYRLLEIPTEIAGSR
jgi:Icc-related predicted phosphoesterase